ncbi:MAG: outer membrane beta-barrel protein [Holophagaceae bacterium]|nr:outer membrane beta-barrel protein [Holophagaceae bacterium]
MKSLKKIMAPFGVLFIVLPLHAQDSGFSVQAGALYGFDSLEKVTRNRTGATLGVSYENTIRKTSTMFRLNLLWNTYPGKTDSDTAPDIKTSLTNVQLSGDVFLTTPVENLKFFAGMSANNYSASYSPEPDPNKVTDGIKMGIRTGLDYRINKRWSCDATFQLTELGVSYADKGGGLNPAWMQFTARYHF